MLYFNTNVGATLLIAPTILSAPEPPDATGPVGPAQAGNGDDQVATSDL